jgi:hypothetical protein
MAKHTEDGKEKEFEDLDDYLDHPKEWYDRFRSAVESNNHKKVLHLVDSLRREDYSVRNVGGFFVWLKTNNINGYEVLCWVAEADLSMGGKDYVRWASGVLLQDWAFGYELYTADVAIRSFDLYLKAGLPTREANHALENLERVWRDQKHPEWKKTGDKIRALINDATKEEDKRKERDRAILRERVEEEKCKRLQVITTPSAPSAAVKPTTTAGGKKSRPRTPREEPHYTPHLTQKYFAELTGVSDRTLREWISRQGVKDLWSKEEEYRLLVAVVLIWHNRTESRRDDAITRLKDCAEKRNLLGRLKDLLCEAADSDNKLLRDHLKPDKPLLTQFGVRI